LIASLALAAVAALPLQSKVESVRVSEHAYYVQGASGPASTSNEGFNSNAGFVVTSEGVVAIDALGTPALGEALLKAIRRVTDKPLRRVILTHYHADHYYGLGPLKQAGAEVWAHASARGYLSSDDVRRRLEQRSRDLYPWVDENIALVPADRWLEADTSFTLGGVRFDVRHVGPAHTAEDLVVSLPREGIVFGGDIVFAGRVPFVGDADSGKWLERIDTLVALKPRAIVPGHGPVSRDPARDLALTRDYLVHVRREMGRAVCAFVPFEEAYAQADWTAFARVPAFEAANRTNAFGTYLQMEKELLATSPAETCSTPR
jgi:glyoxylase-like metal-dependent hydrolase (beta-lactamase superfamily II)